MFDTLPRHIVPIAALLAGVAACAETATRPVEVGSFRVSFVGNPSRGTPDKPLPFPTTPLELRIKIEALRSDTAELDTTYSGWVAINIRPTGKVDQSGPLTVQLKNGVADNVRVPFKLCYGEVRITVTDTGYVPRTVDPGKAACNNRADDDGDGYIDGADRGCFWSNDDSETGGSGATGVSPPVYYATPSIADVQRPLAIGVGGDASPLMNERVAIGQGFMLVSRVSVDGLYVTDFEGAKWNAAAGRFDMDGALRSYRSIFAFNFSTPLNLAEGDCLVQVDGSVDEFFGYTELGKPTWKKGDYAFCIAQAKRAGLNCPAEEGSAGGQQCRIHLENLANTPVDLTTLKLTDDKGAEVSPWDGRTLQTERFEAQLVQLSNVQVFNKYVSCDRNGNGTIDFSDKEEGDCANQCGDEVGCIIKENYVRYNQWAVTFKDPVDDKVTREVTIVSLGAIPNFDPTKVQGKTLTRIVGTLRHLSFGRPPWILEPRRAADCTDCKN